MLCCILSLATIAFAQTATTSLRGVVKDSSGALVQGASITLNDQATGNSYHALTNAAGYYIFPIVSPAHYLITIESAGFATETRTAELLVDQPATIDFKLSVKADAVTVDVSSATETLNFTDASVGNSVGNTTIEALPMEGRDPTSLLSLQPGVLYIGQANSSADSRQGAVAGGRSDQGNITLDGMDDNDQINGTAFTGVLRSTLDSTEEFRVTTSNGTAASGRSSGAQVDLVTKSGTNQYHGALYEYYRPTDTVANSYFNKNEQLSSDSSNTPQKYVLNTFGGAIGAPILKDKLFYFFNYEGKRQAISDVVGATVPTATFMGGGLSYLDSSGNTDTLSPAQVAAMDQPCTTQTFQGSPVCPNGPGANAALLKYLSSEPTATGSVLGDGGYNSGSYFFTSPAPSTLNTSILKIDYNMNAKNHFFVRGNLQKDTTAGDENLPGQPPATFTDDNTKGISAGHTWIPTAHIVNDLRYGYIRQGYQSGGIAPGEWVDIYGLTQPTAQTGTYSLHVPVNNITDTLSWNKGSHTFAFGGNWRGITNHHEGNTNSFDGASTTYEYANSGDLPTPANMAGGFGNSWQLAYADLMGVIPQLYNVYDYTITGATTGVALPEGAPVVKNFHSNELEGYVQDTWHPRPNLTVTYGLRYTLLETPYETNGQEIAPTIDTDAWYLKREAAAQQGQIYEPTISLAPAGKANHAPGYWPEQKKDFAPRIGIVYAPNGKTSIRASAGMYYDHYGEALVNTFDTNGSYGLTAGITNSAGELGFENSPRFTGPHNLPDIPLPAFSPTQAFPFTPSVGGFDIDWGIDNHLKTPYAESFNVSFQHELPGGFTFEEAYVGRLGHHLLQEQDLAEPVDYVDPNGAGDYYSAARTLSQEVDAAPFGTFNFTNAASKNVFGNSSYQKVNNNIAAIPYFENVFPYMKGTDYAGESATQAIFNNAWAPERYTNGETLSLAFLDVFGIWPGSPNYGPGSQGSTFWASQFSSLYALDSIGNSSYNALQFTIRHPASHGLTTDLSYTFSKSLDLGSETERSNIFSNVDGGYTNFAIQNTWNPKLNKGVSDFDTHSLLTGDWVYVLPVGRGKAALGGINRFADGIVGGWQWSGLARWTSGLPFSIESPAYPTNYDNPAMTFNVGGVKTHRSIINGIPHAIDPSVATSIGNGIYFGNPIRLPYAGEAGNRNVYRGDGYFDIDSAVSKSWNLGDWAKLKFAAEAYNITNTVRFDTSLNGLIASSASPNLGTYDSPLSTYRRMQFGMRVDF
jgi:Carboxypeptidase regulatory-like domain/TonB dependent receptor